MPEPLVLKDPKEMQSWARSVTKSSKTLGFVPTMGALHAGHMSLMVRARRENDMVAVSIYVNPTQFGPGEDLAKYPRTFDADRRLCAEAGVDCIFAPETLYERTARTWVEVGGLQDTLCGLSRPGHFRGVATVVAKLFNIVRPDRAYFGRKDAQQLVIIEALCRDLNFGIKIVPCETVREASGLALSSRNRYLSPEERCQALAIFRTLQYCKERVGSGERDAMRLLGEMAEILDEQPDLEIDYVALVDAHTLEDVKTLKGDTLAAIAVKIGETRLIDNIRFEEL